MSLPASRNLTPDQTTAGLSRSVIITLSGEFYIGDVGFGVPGLIISTVRTRWRVGAGAWTTSSSTGVTAPVAGAVIQPWSRTWAALTFPAGTNLIEWQAEGFDNEGVSTGWSSSAYFKSYDAPETPVYTAPAAGATITAGLQNVTWTQTTQAKYRVQVLNGSVVEYDSGVVNSTGTRTHSTPFPLSGARTIRLMTQTVTGGPYSQVDRAVTSTPSPPPVPTVDSATTADSLPTTLAARHRMNVVTSGHQASAPNGTRGRLYIRRVGDTDPVGMLIISQNVGAGGVNWRYWGLPNGIWEVRVENQVSDTDPRSVTTAWTALTLNPTFTGLFISHPTTDYLGPDGVARWVWLQYNNGGAVEAQGPLSSLVTVVGRKSPIVEWDATIQGRIYKVPKVTILTEDVDDLRMLVDMIETRSPLMLRDKRGRKIIGAMELTEFADVPWGWEFGLTITETDYSLDALEAGWA